MVVVVVTLAKISYRISGKDTKFFILCTLNLVNVLLTDIYTKFVQLLLIIHILFAQNRVQLATDWTPECEHVNQLGFILT